MNRKKRLILIAILLLFSSFIGIGFIFAPVVTEYTYYNYKIPDSFKGYKIILISDFECASFGENEEKLSNLINESNPDIIVLTGDIIHEEQLSIENVKLLFAGLPDVPVYFVSGNHEQHPVAAAQYEHLKELMEEYGVIDLDDSTIEINKNGSSIYMTGVKYCDVYISELTPEADSQYFNILLYHGSDSFNILSNFDYDLVLAGHTHGGVVRLPIIGGLISNDGTLFPKYDGGVFEENGTTMISSRGLANTDIPRFYNPPELVLITLTNSIN